MKSHPLHVGHLRHYIWHHIFLDDIIPLFLCHRIHYVYDIIFSIYDVTHTVCMTTQALYLTWNPFYVPSHPLYMSSHRLSRRHHSNYVGHHRWHMYAIIGTIYDIISTLYDNNPWYPCHHMHFIPDITCTIYDMSSTVYDITFTMCVTSHNACISDITHFMFMTYPLYMASHIVLWQYNHCASSQPWCLTSPPLYLCHHTHCINFIKTSVWMTS